MANEIWQSFDEAEILYALIWRKTDDKVYDAVAAADTFDTYTDADIDDYNVELANHVDSDYHSVDFPADIAAGVYRVQIFMQVSAVADTPDADDDTAVAQGEIYWDGTAEIDLYTASSNIDEILEDTGTTLDDMLEELIADQLNRTDTIDESAIAPSLQITVE